MKYQREEILRILRAQSDPVLIIEVGLTSPERAIRMLQSQPSRDAVGFGPADRTKISRFLIVANHETREAMNQNIRQHIPRHVPRHLLKPTPRPAPTLRQREKAGFPQTPAIRAVWYRAQTQEDQ